MDFQAAIRSCFNKYVTFSGRAPRSEYWFFVLFVFLLNIACGLVDNALFGYDNVGVLGGIVSLAVFLPSLAVAIRRLHDLGRSGWWILLTLIPIVGIIILIVFYVQKGEDGPNEYGPDPLAGQA